MSQAIIKSAQADLVCISAITNITQYKKMGCTRNRIIVFLLTSAFCLLPFTFPCSAAEMSEIQQRGYLQVAVKDNLPPLGFRDANGNLQGWVKRML
jgi:ABC-type amino acid transport substrate-binding protein